MKYLSIILVYSTVSFKYKNIKYYKSNTIFL